jgi:hypothetical protein
LQLRHLPVLRLQIWQEPQQAAGWPSAMPHGLAPGMGTQVPFWQVSQMLQLRQVPLPWQTWQSWQQVVGCPGVPPQGCRPGMGTQLPSASIVSQRLQRGTHVPVDRSQTSPRGQHLIPLRSTQARSTGQHPEVPSSRGSQAPVKQQKPPQSGYPGGHLHVRV